MRPVDRAGELFAAFSRVISTAFQDDRLISCPTLSKAPNYGNVLRRFLLRAPKQPMRLTDFCRIVLRYALTNGLHLCFMLLGTLFLRLLKWTPPRCLEREALRSPQKPLFIIDTFAVLPKVAQDRAFQELYMPGLAEEAARCGREVVHLYRLYGSRDPRLLWRAFKALAGKGNGLTELHLLNLRDWLGLIIHAALYPLSLCRLIYSLRHYPADSPESFIREALIRTAGQCVIIGEARRLAARRLGLRLASLPPYGNGSIVPEQDGQMRRTPPVTVASWYENQTLNKAFQRGLALAEDQTGRHVPVIGAQLFIWPDTLLNNHPDDAEVRFRLTPDKVLVNGPHFLPATTRQSYAVGPSLRYGYLFSAESAETQDSAVPADGEKQQDATFDAKPLLVLLSYHPDEIRRVLLLVLPLAQQGRALVYKFHPATRPEDFSALLPPRPTMAAPSLKEALRRAGAVLGSGSGSLAEAVTQGIFVLNVEDPAGMPGLGLNYLPEYGEGILWASVRHTEDVEKALAAARDVQAQSSAQTRRDRIRTFRDLLFTEPTPERIREAFGL